MKDQEITDMDRKKDKQSYTVHHTKAEVKKVASVCTCLSDLQ